MSQRLLLLPGDPQGSPMWVSRDATGVVVARPVDGHGLPARHAPGPDVLVVPAVAMRIAHLPLEAHSPAQAHAAARRHFESDRAGGDGPLHVAVAGPDPDRRWLAVAVDNACMQAWLDQAAKAGFTPDAVVPDVLLLPEPDAGWTVARAYGCVLARSHDHAFAAEPDLAGRIIGDAPTRRIADEPHAIVFDAAGPAGINLLQGAFAPARPGHAPKAQRRLLIAAALLLASPLMLILAGALRDEWAVRQLASRSSAAVARALPAHAHMAPESATGSALAALRAGDRFAGDAAALFAASRAVDGIELHAMRWNAGGWELEVDHPLPAPPAMLLERLAAEGMPALVQGAQPVGRGYRSTLVPAAAERRQ